jgi:protein TonB
VPLPAQEPAPTPVVAVNASLLATASAPENTAVRDLAMSPAATSATPSDGGVARAGPIEPGPAQVLLTNLKFRRYVEPAVRNRSRGPDPAGWVQISFIVGADGRTRDISVVDSSPPGRYEEAALGAVKRWRFEPVREGGTAVERRTGVRLRFQPE